MNELNNEWMKELINDWMNGFINLILNARTSIYFITHACMCLK